MIYGYARCSTNETRQDIDLQLRELHAGGATDKTIYFEYVSGAKTDRPELQKLLDVVQEGGHDSGDRSKSHHPKHTAAL